MSDDSFPEDTKIFLMEYTAGSLGQAERLMAESYIEMSPVAASYARSCAVTGGVLLEAACEPVAMRKDSLKRVLTLIENKQESSESYVQGYDTGSLSGKLGMTDLPAPLVRFLSQSKRPVKWQRFVKGTDFIELPVGKKDPAAFLLRVKPGAKVPQHSHTGRELTLVLDGAYDDEDGRFQKGDLIIIDHDHDHQPVADSETGCICLVINEHPVNFSGSLFSPILNFLTRL